MSWRHVERAALLAAAAAAAAAAVGLAAAGCGDAPRAPGRTSVLLITLDTTRADHLGAYGDAAAQTPVLDGLAARGLLFERTWSPAPITLTSHASILSGLYPFEHGARHNTLYRVGDECLLLSEALAARGWHTGAFVSSMVLARKFGLSQGFDVYRGVTAGASGGDADGGAGMAPAPAMRAAASVVDDALAWFYSVPRDEPYFAWVHLYDAHAPYQAPEPFASRLPTPYDAEIAYADSQIGRLLTGLLSRRPGESPLIIVTADHGESLGQHGEPTHSGFVYDATQRVPLLLVLPDGSRAGMRVGTPVCVTDVPPTVLDVLGFLPDLMPQVRVPSLLRSADAPADAASRDPDAPGADRAIYLETFGPFHEHGWQPLRGLVWRGSKLVDSTRPELYSLDSDPQEEHDEASVDPERLSALRGRLEQLLSVHAVRSGAASAAPGAAELEALQALGYLGGAVDGDPFDPSLPVPRERAALLVPQMAANELLTRGLQLIAPIDDVRGDPAARRAEGEALLGQARAALADLESIAPDDPQTAISLANLELALGRHAQAIDPLERYALVLPRDPRARFALAECYAATEHVDWALAEMAKAVHLDPEFRAAYLWLAETHAQRGETGHAAWWLEQLERAGAGPRRRDAAELAARLQSLRDAAQRHGQPVAPPDAAQVGDLTPEGRRAGR